MQTEVTRARRQDARTEKVIEEGIYQVYNAGKPTTLFRVKARDGVRKLDEREKFTTKDGRPSPELAKKWGRALRADFERRQISTGDKKTTMRQLFDSYTSATFIPKRTKGRGDLSPKTREVYEQLIRTHVLPFLGERTKVAEVSTPHLRQLIVSMRSKKIGKAEKPIAGATVCSTINATKSLFGYAQRQLGVIGSNPATALDAQDLPSAKRETEPRYLTHASVLSLLEKLTPEFRVIAAFLFYAAVRVSEALSARWEDIDTEANVIRVRGTKTDASKGTVPLHPALARELAAHRRRMMQLGFDRVQPDSLIFQTKTGKSPGRRNVHRAISNAAARAGLVPEGAQGVGPHDLRHSAAAYARELGMDDTERAALLRHASPAVTRAMYGGMNDDQKQAVAQKWTAVREAREPSPRPPGPPGAPGGRGAARAENAPDQRLAAVAAEGAGHPITVWCETTAAGWDQVVATHHPGVDPAGVTAFTIPSFAETYIGPRACIGLRQALHAGPPDTLALPMIPYDPAHALMVLLHESEHHAGHVDEQETECVALGQLRHYLTALYKWPAKVTVTKRIKRFRYVLVNGQRVRRAYYVRVRRTVPNPKIEQAVSDALRHRLFCVGKVTP